MFNRKGMTMKNIASIVASTAFRAAKVLKVKRLVEALGGTSATLAAASGV